MSKNQGFFKVASTVADGSPFVGEEFIATGVWSPECTAAYNQLQQTNLVLNPYKGWRFCGNLDFLKDLWRIESLRLFNIEETNLSPLQDRQELQRLALQRVKIIKKRPGFDLGRFLKLKVLAVDWMPGILNLD